MEPTFVNAIFIRVKLSVALLCSLAIGVDAETGRRVALVIGNGAYQNAVHLPNPPNDAKAVAEALRGLDFEVIEAVDLDQPDLLTKVDEFSAKLEGAEAGLFFYAGHGLQVNGQNFLVPIDARLQREAQVKLQTLALDTVLETMEASVATRIVLLDACRDNPLAQQLKRTMTASRSSAVGQGLAEVRTAVGTLIAYATGPGDTASDGNAEHSPFTGALLDHIGTEGLEVRQVLGRVREEVLKQTGDRQVPWDSSSLRGEFYFHPVRPTSSQLDPLPAPASVPAISLATYAGKDREAFDAIEDSRRPSDFKIFLDQYPQSTLAPFAQSRLEELRVTVAESFTITSAGQVEHPPASFAAPQGTQTSQVGGGASVSTAPTEAAKAGKLPTNSKAETLAQSNGPSSQVLAAIPIPARAVAAPSPAEQESALGLARKDWRELQSAVSALGFNTGGADGRPGSNTRKAISDWQRAEHVEVTGYINSSQLALILSRGRTKLLELETARAAAETTALTENRSDNQTNVYLADPNLKYDLKPRAISFHNDWGVYVDNDERGRVCYVASEPIKQFGNYASREPPAILVAKIPGNDVEEFSVQPGYDYLKKSIVQVMVDGKGFQLFTDGRHAWTRTNDQDRQLIQAMKDGRTMTVRGQTVSSTYSLDTYSLRGFGSAYMAIDSCVRG